ncbi:Thiol:disulfide interchange protein DsbD precursor [Gemmata sp. SH-PL17]|uniref:protein-disulfide reductase DsbD family protein n=1 Tax=Gemmata sp. SH-PL17 TaxID=1630693 RepID=UPI00078BFA0C|nr:cytochrome c biogenesis protein CcdA [Gemmata sp. SH-PL17]AMV23046.1 Thiol:disulfide interchange protein DsbD precursor [Gemmata sp. SH-PL17]
MPRSALLPALFVLCGLAAPAGAQFGEEPLAKVASKLPKEFTKRGDVTVQVVPAKAKWGETVTVKVTVTPKSHAWTYPAFPTDPKQSARNTVELPSPSDLIFIGGVVDPPVKWKVKPREGSPGMDQYTDQPVTWEFKAVVSPKAKPGAKAIVLDTLDLQVCDDKNCIPADGRKLPPVELLVEEGASDRVNAQDLASALDALKVQKLPTSDRGPNGSKPPPAPAGSADPTSAKGDTRKTAKAVEAYTDELKTIAASIVPAETATDAGNGGAQTGLWAFVATAALWGLISLVTPCVFPMIPITVSIFLKQAHGSFGERLKLAGVYCLTIISVLGVSAFALLKFMAWLSTQPVTNVLLALLFLVLALSLFGMYEISLPNALQKRLQAKQSKGGVVGTIFGALAFTVISFTCVAPFLGGFAGISAGNDTGGSLIAVPTVKEIAGGLAFATAFAAPFFVLALVPGLMKALPRSGGWLDSVKVVMGFLELAAALKFLRTAELGVLPTPQYFTYDVVLGGWIAISVACGLYLLNVYRLPHDEESPNIGVPRLIFALLFLGLALYLLPATFKGQDGKPQRPAGTVYAWVESFLLPETNKEEGWSTDLKDTIATARKSGRPIFMDFTGETCTNCKYNEHSVFPQPAVREEMQRFEKVQLYTDWLPAASYSSDPGLAARKAEARVNRDFQTEVFKDIKLPLYAVLMPQADGKLKLIGTYEEGKINDPAQFAAFLKDSLEKAKK